MAILEDRIWARQLTNEESTMLIKWWREWTPSLSIAEVVLHHAITQAIEDAAGWGIC